MYSNLMQTLNVSIVTLILEIALDLESVLECRGAAVIKAEDLISNIKGDASLFVFHRDAL